MTSFPSSYIRTFVKFSQATLDNRSSFKTPSRFALIIYGKANELIRRAALNSRIDLLKLQNEIYQLGKEYVRKYGDIVGRMVRTRRTIMK